MKYSRYQILAEVGKGSMGVVYKAHDPQIDRLIAIKVLRRDRLTNQELVQRFLKEAQAIGKLSHPNIVTVYDAGWDQGTVFIAMELLMGKSLKHVIREKEISYQEIVTIGTQVVEALDFVHQKGIVHRDIKPSNIIIDPRGHAKITDFGIAHIEDPTITQQTIPGEILGTPIYMSPEQVMSQPVDGRSDLYSLGVILYEMINGTNPFRGDSIAAIFNSIIHDMPPEPDIPDSRISQALTALIMKSISKDPAQRFQTGRAMAQPLKACLQRRKSDALPQRRAAKAPKRMLPLALIAVGLIAVVGGFAYLFTADKSTQKSAPPAVSNHALPDEAKTTVREEVLSVLKVESVPAGANVFLNGSLKGKTPLKLDLPLGKYEIRLSRQNYYEWEAQLQLNEEGETPLFVRLISMNEKKP
jgi:serine/threonine protein kinase